MKFSLKLEECDFSDLILPLKYDLEKHHPKFLKNCKKLNNYHASKTLIQRLMSNEPYLQEQLEPELNFWD